MRSENLDLMLAMVRVDNSNRYKRAFESYIENGIPALDVNIPGIFFGVFWFFYRKVWTWYVFALMLGHLGIRFLELGNMTFGFTIALLISERVLAGFFGKQLYFKWIQHRISHAIDRGLEGKELINRLKFMGGTLSTSSIEMPKRDS